jgi:hypothetical protein
MNTLGIPKEATWRNYTYVEAYYENLSPRNRTAKQGLGSSILGQGLVKHHVSQNGGGRILF